MADRGNIINQKGKKWGDDKGGGSRGNGKSDNVEEELSAVKTHRDIRARSDIFSAQVVAALAASCSCHKKTKTKKGSSWQFAYEPGRTLRAWCDASWTSEHSIIFGTVCESRPVGITAPPCHSREDPTSKDAFCFTLSIREFLLVITCVMCDKHLTSPSCMLAETTIYIRKYYSHTHTHIYVLYYTYISLCMLVFFPLHKFSSSYIYIYIYGWLFVIWSFCRFLKNSIITNHTCKSTPSLRRLLIITSVHAHCKYVESSVVLLLKPQFD